MEKKITEEIELMSFATVNISILKYVFNILPTIYIRPFK